VGQEQPLDPAAEISIIAAGPVETGRSFGRGTRSRAEGDSRPAANRVRRPESRFSRHRTRSNPGGCVGVVGPKRAGRKRGAIGPVRHQNSGQARLDSSPNTVESSVTCCRRSDCEFVPPCEGRRGVIQCPIAGSNP
jgi:hypothetical protein